MTATVVCDYCDTTGKVGSPCSYCGQPLTALVEPPSAARQLGPALLVRLDKLAGRYPEAVVDLDAAYRRSRIGWVLDAASVGCLAVLFSVEPFGYVLVIGLITFAVGITAWLVARRGTWLGAAAALAKSRPDIGLAWLAEMPDIKRYFKSALVLGPIFLIFFVIMLVQVLRDGQASLPVVLVWLAVALPARVSKVVADVRGYRAFQAHLAASAQ